MIRFRGTSEPVSDSIPLTLPKRLSDAVTLRLLGDAFNLMIAVLIDGDEIADVADRIGYTHGLSEQQTPLLGLQSYIHEREEHRLILNTHHYPNDVRQVLHLTIPGGMTLEAFERFRKAHECVGSTYYWHDHIYGEWRTAGAQPGASAPTTQAQSPVFIELRQDVFQGEPLLLRVIFHRLMART